MSKRSENNHFYNVFQFSTKSAIFSKGIKSFKVWSHYLQGSAIFGESLKDFPLSKYLRLSLWSVQSVSFPKCVILFLSEEIKKIKVISQI